MRKLTVMLLATLAACSGTEPPAEPSAESSAPTLRELYACNFLDGKGMSDLEDARDFLVEQIAQIGSADLDNMESFLWTPYKARTEYDFLWFNQYESIAAFGRAETALANRAAAVNAKFGEVVSCNSSLSMRQQIYDGGADVVTGDRALLETYACTLNPGKNMDDVTAAIDHWRGVVSGIDGFKNYDAYMATPYIANTPIDLFYLGVHDDVSDFAAHTTAYLDSAGAAEADRRFAEVHDCESGLWWGRIMIGSAG